MSDKFNEAMSERSRLPRKTPRKVEKGGRCIACNLEPSWEQEQELWDGLCSICYTRSLEGQERTTQGYPGKDDRPRREGE